MRNVSPRPLLLAAAATALLLGGCARGGGFDRARPDEFMVARQAPLVVPPDYALVPPAPGAARTGGPDASAQALEALFGGTARRSGVERATIAEAGSDAADPGIRSTVGDPSTNVVDKGQTTRDITAAPEGDGQDARAATPQ